MQNTRAGYFVALAPERQRFTNKQPASLKVLLSGAKFAAYTRCEHDIAAGETRDHGHSDPVVGHLALTMLRKLVSADTISVGH